MNMIKHISNDKIGVTPAQNNIAVEYITINRIQKYRYIALLYDAKGRPPLSYLSLQPVLHDWCNKSRGVCYHVFQMVYTKYALLLIGNSSPCSGGSEFPFSLSEWSFIICPTPYNRK